MPLPLPTGKLLLASTGTGTADANSSVGALDLGGASTQISFFVPDQDILANMFKLQIGAQKHWNVYTHSFLYFGVNSARERMHIQLVEEAKGKRVGNPCLPAGYNEDFEYEGKTYKIEGEDGTFQSCFDRTTLLLRKVRINRALHCNAAQSSRSSSVGKRLVS